MHILRTDYQGRGKWKPVAHFMNAVGKLINDAVGENGIEVDYRGGRLVISGEMKAGSGSAFPWDLLSFGFQLAFDADTGITTCTIFPGTIRIHGVVTAVLLASVEVDLTASPESWVFLQRSRAGGSITVHVSATAPDSTAAILRIPLYRFDGAPGAKYTLGHIAHIGDVHFDSPL